MTLAELRDDVQRRLAGADTSLWPSAELDNYIREGYDRLCIETGMLWDFTFFPDYSNAFSYTAEFERVYLLQQAGWRVQTRAVYTSLFERDYVDNAPDPANHNFYWERNGGFA